MFKIGAPISLELEHDDQSHHDVYKCKIVDLKNNYLYVDYPISERTGRTSIFFEGTQFKVKLMGNDQAVYMFETEIIARKKKKIPVLVLHFPGKDKMMKIQRRKYVRVETAIDTAAHPLEGNFQPFTTITFDVSGGGTSVLLPPKHNVNRSDLIHLTFVLAMNNGSYKYIDAEGRVLKILEGSGRNRDKAAIEFSVIADASRQDIVQFCFERQLDLRRKENY
ncbi:flagellar brake protein [Thalassobacillus hwangdonensis]|uniref:Flagellar brake protein n=1 Tax=Thalassobacillus hwangdonensis TaxID=546108 RepID=A0ABW3KZG2_9BACI